MYFGTSVFCLIVRRAGVEIQSLRSHIRNHFVLEWKSTLKIVESTLKIVESTLKRVIQTGYSGVDSSIIWEWIQLQMK